MPTPTGPIAWQARSEIPATWDALAKASTYGDYSLQQRLDYIKYSLFGGVIDQSLEATSYSPPVQLLAAKMLALEVIPAGADYWSDQSIQFSAAARQNSESVGYPDRINSLWKIHARLLVEVEKLKEQIGVGGGILATRRMSRPKTSTDGQGYRTPDPWAFPMQVTTYDRLFYP